jgi:uncharacterized protein
MSAPGMWAVIGGVGGHYGSPRSSLWPSASGATWGLRPERFFDIAVVHLLTTSTIDRLRKLYPQGRFEARRFRPNIVVSTGSEDPGFVENDWIGRTVLIGEAVRLAITEPCPRCVMITLPQADLPKDSGILRTAPQHNAVNVGVYASVVNGGTIRRGDAVVFA